MESSKLVNLLKHFEPGEWKIFNQFVQSTFFNRRPKLVELLTLLNKAKPNWNPKNISKAYIYEKLFPDEKYKEHRIVELMNALIKLIEQFWLVNKPMDATEKFRNLALAYHQHGFENYRDIYLKKSIQALQQDSMETESFHNHLFTLELEQHRIIEAEGKRNQEPNLQNLHHQFDAYYICTKLKYYCKVLNYQNFRSHQYNIRMMDAILEEAAQPLYAEITSIQIYYHGVFTLLNLDNEENFQKLKGLLTKNTSIFSIEELQNIFVLARNFCVKNMYRGKREYIKEALFLYKIEIAENIILEDGKVPDADCRNIIRLALLAKDVQWALSFLREFKPKIRELVYTLSLANVYFEQQKYQAILQLLLPLNFKEVLLELAARGLILRTYFQLCRTTNNFEYEDKLEAYIESFSAFLKRKKEVLTKGYIRYLNLIKFIHTTNKLYWKPTVDKTKLANIHQEILNTPETAEWDWLKEISKP